MPLDAGLPASAETLAAPSLRPSAVTCRAKPEFDEALVASIIREMVIVGARRRFAISVQGKVMGSTGALIRRICGWSLGLPEMERERAAKRAAKLTKAIEGEEGIDDPLLPVVVPLVKAAIIGREPFDKLRKEAEREMIRLARRLPAHAWVKSVRGLGELGFAVIVTEVGAVGEYRTVQGLWKRCGLGLVGGERQRRHRDPEMAKLHGFNPRRRAEIHGVVGEPLIRGQWRGPREGVPAHSIGPYGEAYGRKKAEYLARNWRPKHADTAARRYATKLLLRDLWVAWRRDVGTLGATT